MAFHSGVGIHIPQRFLHIACTNECLAHLLQQTDRNQTSSSRTPTSSASTVRHDCPHRCHGTSD
nr:MAG TPA: hypothetical protein [Caudoviricetes sp.]